MTLHLRGGYSSDFPEPPDYGPTNGKDWIIANVGPRFVSRPVGAIDISPPGGLTQGVLDAAAADAVFWLLPGTHTSIYGGWDYGLLPRNGQTIVAPSDGTCVINGQGHSVGIGRSAGTQPDHVTVRGGTWTNYGLVGVYPWHQPICVGPYCTVEDVTLTQNLQSGIGTGGYNGNVSHGYVVRYCNITSNGRYGYHFYGGGAFSDWLQNGLFEHNYVYDNNTAHYDPGDDAGGSKNGYNSTGNIYRYNYYTANYGFDCWFDTGCTDVTIEENVFEKHRTSANPWMAPFHWEDCGPGIFRRNHVTLADDLNNYPGGLENGGVRFVACDGQRYTGSVKKEFEVCYNIIETDGYIPSLVSWQQDGRAIPRSLWIHHNDFYQPWAIASNHYGFVGNLDQFTGRDHRWYSNRYNLASLTAANWQVAPPVGNSKTWAQWQASPYFLDLDSTRVQL